MKEVAVIANSDNRCYKDDEEEIDCKKRAQQISELLQPLLKSFLRSFLKEEVLTIKSMKTTNELGNINNGLEYYLPIK